MSSLDQPELYSHLDPTKLRERIAGFPDQCGQAWREGKAFSFPAAYSQAQEVVLLGMGGSAIGGDLLAGLASLEQGPPVTVLRDYRVPLWLGPKTLAIVSSYSGNTEETIAMYQQARERKACLVVVSSGGTLSQLALRHGVPLFSVGYLGEPRSALGYSFVVPLAFLGRLGLLPDKMQDMEEAVRVLRHSAATLAPDVPQGQNLAKSVALDLHARLPVIYGAGFLSGAARRWKTQLNENSKVWAFWEELPELGHNTAQGYASPSQAKVEAFVVLLHSRFLYPRTSVSYGFTQELLALKGLPHRRLEAEGESPLAHLLSTVLLGDWVSYYLAMLNQIDPSLTPAIDSVKRRMAEGIR